MWVLAFAFAMLFTFTACVAVAFFVPRGVAQSWLVFILLGLALTCLVGLIFAAWAAWVGSAR